MTQRDLALLTELGEVGLMSAPMVAARHFGKCSDMASAERSFRRRLKIFIELGYVRADRLPVAGCTAGLLTICRLSAEGAEFLAELTGRSPRRAGASQGLNPVTVPHRLGVVATRLAFDDAHRALGFASPEWLLEYDLSPHAGPTFGNDRKFVLYESFRGEGKRVVCWPDAAARIRPPNASEHDLLAYFEYDRSTETTKQFAAKVAGYRLLVATERYRQHWPVISAQHLVRVLVVVRSVERMRNLMEVVSRMDGAQLFRFATYEKLQPVGLLTIPIWHAIDGRVLPILQRRGSVQASECASPLSKQCGSELLQS
jgi:hypothetical protein